MIRLRPFLVLALLACWLPATAHCALEAAEIVQATCCESDWSAPAADEHSAQGPHCDEWESKIVSSHDGLQLKAPDLACLCLLCVAPTPVEDGSSRAQPVEETPPVWRTSWNFERRTALPVRAPALN